MNEQREKEDPFFLILIASKIHTILGRFTDSRRKWRRWCDHTKTPSSWNHTYRNKDFHWAVEHVPVARVTNLVQAVQQLKETGFWVFGTDMTGTNFQNGMPKDQLL